MFSRRDVFALAAGFPLYFHSLGASAAPRDLDDPVKGDLAAAFIDPPDATRPYVLWMWMGCNISEAGITRDLEAMKAAGIGGATIFSLADTLIPWAGVIEKSPTPEIVTWTDPWWAMVRHAALECRRLGLDLILHNCAGYESSGGTWITPDLAMQEVIWTETKVEGGKPVSCKLDRAIVDPHPHAPMPNVYIPDLGKIAAPIMEARKTYYRDIAVIALPSSGAPTMDQVFDLTAHMQPDGTFAWEAPDGEWSIYRFGHTLMGTMIQPAQWDAIGLECDKMSKAAVTFHVEHVLGEIKRRLGDLAGTTFSTLYFDSYEAGDPTWTPKMAAEFQMRRGYDILPWLPALAGRTLGSKRDTDAFHADFQRTVKDLYRDCYWATPKALCHRAGLQFVAEPYTGPWEIEEVVKHLDHASMEFWTSPDKWSPVAAEPIAACAHDLGQRIMGAEAFTTDPSLARWNEHPAWLKAFGDAAFCAGVNRMNVHHFVQQPWGAEYQPGVAMGQWGVHFGRHQTWWEPGKAWFRYLWRCQTLLQAGQFVAASDSSSARFETTTGLLDLHSIHRRFKDTEIYFIANIAQSRGRAKCSFPVVGKQPELWDPVLGTIRDLPDFEEVSGRTVAPLDFDVAQSVFVIFRKPSSTVKTGAPNFPALAPQLELGGGWDVQFDPAWGGPASVRFDTLDDWTHRPEQGIKYYSGTAVYTKSVHLPPIPASKRTYLDLGAVNNLATIKVNGQTIGVVWTAPWRIEIGSALKAGDNTIEIAVTNVWANRLIGDEQEPADIRWEQGDPAFKSGQFLKEFPDWFLKREKRPSAGRYTFTTWNYFTKDSSLSPSGLLGPVRLLSEL